MRTTSRSSKTIIVLLAAIVALLWHGTRVQRRMVRRLTSFGMFYPGEDAVSTIGGWFGGIGDAVRDYVQRVVKAVADALQSGIDFVLSVAQNAGRFAYDFGSYVKDFAIGVAHDMWAQATSAARSLFDQANSLTGWVFDAAKSFAADLFHQANSLIGDVANGAASLARSLFDQANSLIGWVFDAAKSFAADLFHQANSLIGDVANGAASLARSLFDQANSLIAAGIDAANAAARSLFDETNSLIGSAVGTANEAIANAVHDVYTFTQDQASTVNDYLFSTVQTIIDAIITVIDWVIALAEFPFTTARDLWASMRNTGGATIRDHMPGMVDRWADHIGAHARNNANARDKGYVIAPLPGRDYGVGGGGGTGGAVGPGVGTPDRLTFAAQLLTALGAPQSASNTAFLVAWMTHENTRATYNPLATTLDYGQNTRFNSVGVRNYVDLATGVAATAATLTGSGYPRIVADLRNGDGHQAGQEHAELSRWSGGGYDTIAA